ncbi:MAG: hypothetical protein LBJ73_01995 [Rickettsiales bacterium]|nr:hypothetical protein [Rickettsiales bacterium]
MINRETKQPATDSEKMAEYDRISAAVKELGKNGDGTQPYNHTADKYEKFTTLRITPEESGRLVADHIRKDLAAIRRKFPEFDSYSERRKLVIMDMQYNHGGFGKFPIFSKAVENGHWKIAAEHSKSGDIPRWRNKWRYDGLLDE